MDPEKHPMIIMLEEKMFSKHFFKAYRWYVLDYRSIDWCIANTVKIEKETAELKRLFIEQVNSKKRNHRIIRKLVKRCKHWILKNEEYGFQNKRTAKRFKKFIKYIRKVEHDEHQQEDSDTDEWEDEKCESSEDNHCKLTSNEGGLPSEQPSLGWVNSTNNLPGAVNSEETPRRRNN